MSITETLNNADFANAEYSAEQWDQMIEALKEADSTVYTCVRNLFAYAVKHLVEGENTTFINALVAALKYRNRAMVITLALKCSIFKFDRKNGKFEGKRQFKNDKDGQEAENAALEYAERNYNFFVLSCNSNIWDYETAEKKPKPEKKVSVKAPDERMVASFRAAFLGSLDAGEFEKQAMAAIEAFKAELAFYAETKANNPAMDKASITRLYKKHLEAQAAKA